MRRRMGAAALEMDAAADGSWQEQWRATVAARLPSQHWPQRTVLITAVDAQTGEPVVFDRHSGVDLVDAVAASCASGRPYRIGDRRYIDGGYRSKPRMPTWQPGAHGCWCCHPSAAERGNRWTGACTSRHRSTSFARAAAGSRRSCRTATPSAVRRERDGSVAACARRSSRLRARQRPRRAARRSSGADFRDRALRAEGPADEGEETVGMSTIPESVREFVAGGLWAHVVTLNRRGEPHVNLCWAGFGRRRDRVRVVLQRPGEHPPPAAQPHACTLLPGEGVRRRRAVSPTWWGGKRERCRRLGARAMDHLAVGDNQSATYPARDMPSGWTFRVAIDKIYGQGPWNDKWVKRVRVSRGGSAR